MGDRRREAQIRCINEWLQTGWQFGIANYGFWPVSDRRRRENTSLSSPWLRRPANWKLPTKGADHGDQHNNHRSPAVEQGKARRPKDATQTQGDMGDSHKTSNCVDVEISPSSIWLSIASSVRAISCNCGYATSATARAWRPAPSSFNRKPADLYSSRLRSRHALRYPRGFPILN